MDEYLQELRVELMECRTLIVNYPDSDFYFNRFMEIKAELNAVTKPKE